MTTHRSQKSTGRSLWTHLVPTSALALTILIASNDPAAAAREQRGKNSGKATVTESRAKQKDGAKANGEVRRSDARRSQSPPADVEKRSEVRRQEKPAARSGASAPKQTAPRRERAQVEPNRVDRAPSRSHVESNRGTSRSRVPSQRVEPAPSKSHGRANVEPPSRTSERREPTQRQSGSSERREQIQRDWPGSQREDVRKHSDRSWERSYDRGDGDHQSYYGERYSSNTSRGKYDAQWRSHDVVHREYPRQVSHVQNWCSYAQDRWSADIHVVGRPAYQCYRPVRYVPSRVVYWYERPYYSYVSLGVFFPRFWIDFAITDAAPYGYTFYDPYCDDFFPTVSAYQAHLHYYGHPAALDVVYIDDIACDPVYVQRAASPYWSIEIAGYFD
jgi:hypothetical protein